MRYAVIVWATESQVRTGAGIVYAWFESLATAQNTALILTQIGPYRRAVVLKLL